MGGILLRAVLFCCPVANEGDSMDCAMDSLNAEIGADNGIIPSIFSGHLSITESSTREAWRN